MKTNMLQRIRYFFRIGPGYEVFDGRPGRDFGPHWISGLVFYLYRSLWCKDEYVRVEYFFEYVYYTVEDAPLQIAVLTPDP